MLKRILMDELQQRGMDEPIFASRKHDRITGQLMPITRSCALRDMRAIAELAGIDYSIGTHTLRKTFGYHYYRETGNLALLMDLYRHSKPEVTLLYIGITDDDRRAAMQHIGRLMSGKVEPRKTDVFTRERRG